MSKRIHPAALAAQRDLFGLSPATKKPTLRKKPQDRRPESAVRRLERMLTTRETVERARAHDRMTNSRPLVEACERSTDDILYIVGPDGRRIKASELTQQRFSNEKRYTKRGETAAAKQAQEQRELTRHEKAYTRCIKRIAQLRQQHRISYDVLVGIATQKLRDRGQRFTKADLNFEIYAERASRACDSTFWGAAMGAMWARECWSEFSTAERLHVLAAFKVEGTPDFGGPIVSDEGLTAIRNEALRLVKRLAEQLPPPDLSEEEKRSAPDVLRVGAEVYPARGVELSIEVAQ